MAETSAVTTLELSDPRMLALAADLEKSAETFARSARKWCEVRQQRQDKGGYSERAFAKVQKALDGAHQAAEILLGIAFNYRRIAYGHLAPDADDAVSAAHLFDPIDSRWRASDDDARV